MKIDVVCTYYNRMWGEGAGGGGIIMKIDVVCTYYNRMCVGGGGGGAGGGGGDYYENRCCVYLLQSHDRGNSNECTQHTNSLLSIQKIIHPLFRDINGNILL